MSTTPGCCTDCGVREGHQHKGHCHRTGMVTADSDYFHPSGSALGLTNSASFPPSNEGAKREVATKATRNIPENIPMPSCQPTVDIHANSLKNQQIDREVILDGIITAILGERRDQDRTWGGPENDDKHTGFDWVALITKQLGRAVDGAFVGDAPDYVFAMVRVAALAVAAIESVRRQSWARVD